jgi:hypothetical protein
MFGESLGRGWPQAADPDQRSQYVWSWIGTGSYPTCYGLLSGPNRWFGDWSSNHTGIVQFAYCDGSVHGLRVPAEPAAANPQPPAYTAFTALSTMTGGEVADVSAVGN